MGRYLAEIEALDADVGRLMSRLEALGLAGKTIVVFSSDQGADMTKAGLGGLRFNQMGYNGAFRGGKHTFFEGGQRVPFIVRWPGRVAENSVNEKSVISGVDWLPTLCAITGIPKVPPDLDGENVSAVWQGNHRERTKPLLWKTNNARSEMAIRDGKWKLFDPNRKKGQIELFDIVADPAESQNLTSRHPEVVRRLTEKIGRWNATLPKEYTKSNDKD
jgi:N-acetylgalactosamine-6-sulfatase